MTDTQFCVLVSDERLDDYARKHEVVGRALDVMQDIVMDEIERRHNDREDEGRWGSDHG